MKFKIIDYSKIVFGAGLMAFSLNSFLIPCKIAAGGISGIATIAKIIFNIPLSVTIIVFNIPLFVIAYKMIGKRFLLNSLLGTFVFSLLSEIVKIPMGISDPVIGSSIGGVIMGIGVGIILTSNATTGGTEIAAKAINKKSPDFSVGKVMFIFDSIVILLAGVLFKDFELSLYAALSVYVSSKVIDYMTEGPNFSKCAFVISHRAEEISLQIRHKLGRGVTGINAKGMHKQNEYLMLMCAVPKREMYNLKKIILSVDSSAFVIFTDAKEIYGTGFKINIS